MNAELRNIQPTLTYPQCTDIKSGMLWDHNALTFFKVKCTKAPFLSQSKRFLSLSFTLRMSKGPSGHAVPLSKLSRTDYSARLPKDTGRNGTSMHQQAGEGLYASL